MGNWHISIQGIGPHHNGNESDADQMARRFVRELRAAGHAVGDAAFTHGGSVNMNDDKPTIDEKVSPAAQPMP